MPDYAPNFTSRYILQYRSAGVPHTMTLRGYIGEAMATTITRSVATIQDLFDALSPSTPDNLAFEGAFYIAQGDEVTVPATVPTATPGTSPAGNFSPQDKITTLGFAGKSSLGAKAKLFVFGVQMDTDVFGAGEMNDFLITAGEFAHIDAAVSVLNTNELPAIDGGQITWYPRVTIKINDHWLKPVRRGVIS